MGAGRRIIGAAAILLAGWGLAHWFRPAKQDGVAESESLPLLAAHPASATGARALPDVEDVAVSRTAERSGAGTETNPSAAGPRPPERSAAESGSLRTSTRAAGRHTELAFRGPSRPPQMASSYAEAVARTAQVLACRPVVSGGGLQQPMPTERRKESRFPTTHRIRDGDTLESISRRFYGHPKGAAAIFQANRAVLARPDVLPIGARLTIPPLDRLPTAVRPVARRLPSGRIAERAAPGPDPRPSQRALSATGLELVPVE